MNKVFVNFPVQVMHIQAWACTSNVSSTNALMYAFISKKLPAYQSDCFIL